MSLANFRTGLRLPEIRFGGLRLPLNKVFSSRVYSQSVMTGAGTRPEARLRRRSPYWSRLVTGVKGPWSVCPTRPRGRAAFIVFEEGRVPTGRDVIRHCLGCLENPWGRSV